MCVDVSQSWARLQVAIFHQAHVLGRGMGHDVGHGGAGRVEVWICPGGVLEGARLRLADCTARRIGVFCHRRCIRHVEVAAARTPA